MTKLIHISKYRPSIFQGKFDFADYSRDISLVLEHPLESALRRVLVVALVALACGYVYFVSASVLNVIARKEALTNVASLQGSVGGLEQQYLSLSQSVSPTRAASLGLAPVAGTDYVYRAGNAAAVTIDRNEI